MPEPLEQLDEFAIEAWRTGQYGVGYDPALFAALSGGSPWSTPDVGVDASAFSSSSGTEPLEELTVEAKRAFVPPPPPVQWLAPAVEIASSIGAGVLAGLSGIGALLLPTPTAPREMDEAPEPLEIEVTGKRPPPPPTIKPQFDEFTPPNWNDLVDWTSAPGRPHYAFPVPFDANDTDSERRSTPAPRTPRERDALPTVDEIVVTARPSRAPRPAPAPDVYRAPLFNPTGFPSGVPYDFPVPELFPELQPERRPATAPAPRVVNAPYLFADPDVVDLLAPFVDPLTPTLPFAPVQPDRDVRVPLRPAPRPPQAGPLPPTFIADPFAPLDPQLDPMPAPIVPRTPDKTDACGCAEPKKKKKPREPRRVCYRGTYTEKSSSLSKSPKEEIPCQ